MKPRQSSKSPLRPSAGAPADFAWAKLNDDELLDVRLCDLGLKIEGTALEDRVAQLYAELEARGLTVRPHCWLSEEWFSPDDVPGIAIPFYLAHPRLTRLEDRMMLEAEGGTRTWCMRILRHEAGHAIDTAYRLHRRKPWQRVFGKSSRPYPDFYQPRPMSRNYVLHLNSWYAQSHPWEDFAETFAVWLAPDSRWRSRYARWPALKKLQYVDDLMGQLAGRRPLVRSRQRVEPLSQARKTLREHYQAKQVRYSTDHPEVYDRDLRRLFSSAPRGEHESAAAFLRRARPELRRTVAHWTGEHPYVIDQVLQEMIVRCRQLGLYCDRDRQQARQDAVVLLTVQTMNYLQNGHHRFAL